MLAMAMVASTGIAPADEQVSAAGPEVICIGPPERARSDIEAWNVGIISARRPELTPAENLKRDGQLCTEIRQCFGLLHLRGRYVADYGMPHVKTTEGYACLVSSHADDSGNLKGFLRQYGRKYGQDSAIYKGYYRDAVLLALRDLPALGMKDGETRSLGRFHPNRRGVLYTLMTRGAARPPGIALEDLQPGPAGVDWLGGRWEDLLFQQSRAARRLRCDRWPWRRPEAARAFIKQDTELLGRGDLRRKDQRRLGGVQSGIVRIHCSDQSKTPPCPRSAFAVRPFASVACRSQVN
jgi:hypothetical protein